MEMTDVFDEERARRLLAGTGADAGRALALIDRHLRLRLCGWLRKRFPSLAPDDLANAWSETLLNVLEAARGGRFDPGRPLLPWLCQIANARAVDHLRRSACREELLECLGRAAAEAEVRRGGQPPGPAECREIMELIREAVAELPPQQRRVVEAFVDHYPESARLENLHREVCRGSEAPPTVAAVKRALQEGRAKVRAFLRARGYTLGERGDA